MFYFEAVLASIWEADLQLLLELRKKLLIKGRHLVLEVFHQFYKDLVKVSFLKVCWRLKNNYIFSKSGRYRRNDDESRNGNMLQLRDDPCRGLSGRGIKYTRFPYES